MRFNMGHGFKRIGRITADQKARRPPRAVHNSHFLFGDVPLEKCDGLFRQDDFVAFDAAKTMDADGVAMARQPRCFTNDFVRPRSETAGAPPVCGTVKAAEATAVTRDRSR